MLIDSCWCGPQPDDKAHPHPAGAIGCPRVSRFPAREATWRDAEMLRRTGRFPQIWPSLPRPTH